MKEKSKASDSITGAANSPAIAQSGVTVRGDWTLIARDPDGNIIAEREWQNLVTDVGLNELLANGLGTGTWYLGLTDGTPTAAAVDTMASHAGWAEVVAYDEAARQAWTDGAVSGQSVDNSASPALFTINANGTVLGGAFLADNNTKSGTTGILYAIGAFTGGDITLSSGSTVTITATFTTAAA